MELPDGCRQLALSPEVDAPSPLWERGANVALESLSLSSALAVDIARPGPRWGELAEDEEADVAEPTWLAVVDELNPNVNDPLRRR